MRTFVILWLGQMASSIGSGMTYFSLTLWVWHLTESVTAIALIAFFFQLPQIGIALFSGILVDRVPRQLLLVLSDGVAAGCTLSVGLLAAAQHLQIWNLYCIAAIYGCFGHIQMLTYTTTVPLIVPKQQYLRANSMGSLVGSGAAIVAPALAGILYPKLGLSGITLIDLATFAIAISTVLLVRIPSSKNDSEPGSEEPRIEGIWQEITFGFRYIGSRLSLVSMVVVLSAFVFMSQLGEALYEPMILARTQGNAQVLGMAVAASGVGGVIGGLILSIWGGFRSQIRGMLIGFVGTGVSNMIFGMGQQPLIWFTAQFCASLHSPLVFSSYTAVWYAKVAPKLQGRVFAADHFIGLVIAAIASLLAGPLADQIFEPSLRSGGTLSSLVSPILGVGPGSGIALLYVIVSIGIIVLGVSGFAVQHLRNAEEIMPDYDDGQ
ncbi:MAG: MFS transporter [Drouetiella hepatica Uher 2000/2452]|uniref:MFS transporter n=1 Tax=Drouetiella hepatica Uher 2000/2452 TaxID=904376 RepID=A0A951QDY9_9CYAN|nr:MFS transporter [Drouetiella hepatica Uher 2000/2452]